MARVRGIGFQVAASIAWAQIATPSDLSGEWELTTNVLGNPLAHRLTLKVEKGKLTGSVSRGKQTPITGTVAGDLVRFEFKDDGTVNRYEGRLRDGILSGTVAYSGESSGATPSGEWRAKRPAADKPASPRTLDYEPTAFHSVFSSTTEPVMRPLSPTLSPRGGERGNPKDVRGESRMTAEFRPSLRPSPRTRGEGDAKRRARRSEFWDPSSRSG